MPEASIRVICRFRPINKREQEEKVDAAWSLDFPDSNGGSTVRVVPAVKNSEPQVFNFDRVFHNPQTTQQEIYEKAAKDTIEDIIEGYNGTIFAYGQTGAGKSFTMFGPEKDIENPILKGIIPRACEHIFQHIKQDKEGTEFTIKASFLEIYKEIVKDLLNPKNSNLKVRETPSRGVWIEGLTEQYVGSVQEVLELIHTGEKFRSVASTGMNAVSSRSHSLVILTLEQKTRDGSSKKAKLNLVDLAGSEKVGKTGATGETLEEAKKINQSLSALGNCINALTKAKRGHIPYRDSRLTHILRESLGGNCKTTLMICCSPHAFNVEETISTLKFGQRAKSIKNAVSVNKQRSVEELMAIINKLDTELSLLKRYVSILESELQNSKGSSFDLTKFKQENLKVENIGKTKISLDSPSKNTETMDDETSSVFSDESFDSKQEITNRTRVMLPTPKFTGTDSLSFVEAQLEIEKIRENANLQIMEIQEELEQLVESESILRKQFEQTSELLSQEREQLKQSKMELENKTILFKQEVTRLELALKESKLQNELSVSLQREKEQLLQQVEQQKRNLVNETESQQKLQLEKKRVEKELLQQNELLQIEGKKIQDLENMMLQKTTLVSQLTLKREELELNLQSLTKSNQLLQNQLIESQQNLKQLKKSLGDKENDLTSMFFFFLSHNPTASGQQIKNFKQRIVELEFSTQQLKKEKEEALLIQKDFQLMKEEMNKRTKHSEELEFQLKLLKAEKQTIQEQVYNLNQSVENLNHNKEQLQQRLEQEKKKVEIVSQKSNEALKELEKQRLESEKTKLQLQKRIEEKTYDCEMLETEKKEMSIRIKSQEEKLLEKESEIRTLISQLISLKQDLHEKGEQIFDLEERLSKEATMRKSDLSQKSQELSESLVSKSKLEEDNEKLLHDLKDQRKQLQTMTMEKQQMVLVVEQLNKQLELARSSTNSFQQEAIRLEREKEFKDRQLKKYEEEVEQKQIEFSQTRQTQQTRIEQLEKENEKLVEKSRDQQDKLIELESKIKQDEVAILHLTQEKKLFSKTMEEKLKFEQQENQLMEEQTQTIKNLQSTVQQQKELNDQLNHTVQQLESQMKLLQEKSLNQGLELQELGKTHEFVENELRLRNEQLETQKLQINHHQVEIKQLKISFEQEKQHLETKLKEISSKTVSEKKEILDLEQENELQKVHITNLERQNRELLEELQKRKELTDKSVPKDLHIQELSSKEERIKFQEKEIEDLQLKLDGYSQQLGVAMRAYLEIESRYKSEIRRQEDLERHSQQRANLVNVRKPIKADPSTPTTNSTPTSSSSSSSVFRSVFGWSKSPIPARSDVSEGSDRQGWLTKQGSLFKTWNRRWFVLKLDTLYYFTDDQTQDAKGSFEFDGTSYVADASDITKKPFCFGIYHPSGRSLLMASESAKDRDDWMDIIKKNITSLRKRQSQLN